MATPSSRRAAGAVTSAESPHGANEAALPYTDELRGKLAGALARLSLANVLDDDTAAVLAALGAHGLRLVDASRERAMVDERVYESALRRGHDALTLCRHQHPPHRLPAAAVWKGLPT